MRSQELQARGDQKALLAVPSVPQGIRDRARDRWEYQAPELGLPPRLLVVLVRIPTLL